MTLTDRRKFEEIVAGLEMGDPLCDGWVWVVSDRGKDMTKRVRTVWRQIGPFEYVLASTVVLNVTARGVTSEYFGIVDEGDVSVSAPIAHHALRRRCTVTLHP